MKGLISILIIAISFFIFASDIEAQILKKFKDKAKKSVENKVEQKIDNEIEKAAERMVENTWNSVFGEGFGDAEGRTGFPFSMNSNVTIEDVYTFDIVTTMQIENIKKNGKEDELMLMYMHFNEEELYTGTKISNDEMKKNQEDVLIIFDFKNEAMVMLMDSKDGKFSFAYDWKKAIQYAEELEDYDQDEINWEEVDEWQGFKKIGTRNISGYKCEGYESVTEDSKMEIWVTRDEDLGMHKMFQANSEMKQLKGKVPENYPEGMMMQMIIEDLKSGEKTKMSVTEINKNASVSYSMNDYPVLSFGNSSN
ncbi:MAG: DUF4412 domain-containing protein [Balneolaceae bacterium]